MDRVDIICGEGEYIMKKRKMEFSKKWLIGCICVSLFFTLASYVLAWFDKNAVETLSITIIETLWGTSAVSFVFYAGLNGVRAYTGSKWGVPTDETDKVITDEEPEEINYSNRYGTDDMSVEDILNEYDRR